MSLFLGGSARDMWDLVAPFMYNERLVRGDTYQRNFEDLAAGVDEKRLLAEIAKLRKRPPPNHAASAT